MKLLMLFSISVALLPAADRAVRSPSGVVAKPLEIPAGAVQSEDGYRYTDAQGKKWLYRKTPFGVARLEDPGSHGKGKFAALDDGTKAVAEDGDLIRFERPGPFGTYKWTRKKSELSASESAIWQRDRAAGKQD